MTGELKPHTKQSGGANISTATWLKSLYVITIKFYQLENLIKTYVEGIIITSLMWDYVTEIKLNIFGRVWL